MFLKDKLINVLICNLSFYKENLLPIKEFNNPKFCVAEDIFLLFNFMPKNMALAQL